MAAADSQDMRQAERGELAPEGHIATRSADGSLISDADVRFWHEHGYLRIPQVYSPAEMDLLDSEFEWLKADWAEDGAGWQGPWRRVLMDEQTEAQSKLIAMHELHLYSQDWMKAITKPELGAALGRLIGPAVEVHHSTMHTKPPETGHPFPMHQDHPFYAHDDLRYADVLVHLDDTFHENGEIRFLDGSHKKGYIPHVMANAVEGHEPALADGASTPHLSTDEYRHADTVAVPAKRGDVVLFNLCTVHGSYINRFDRDRRLVRVGYRHPENAQTSGHALGRPGVIVNGKRPRRGPDGSKRRGLHPAFSKL